MLSELKEGTFLGLLRFLSVVYTKELLRAQGKYLVFRFSFEDNFLIETIGKTINTRIINLNITSILLFVRKVYRPQNLQLLRLLPHSPLP